MTGPGVGESLHSNRMGVLGLYAEDYPWDVRIEKILGGLAADGHAVSLVCRNLQQRPSRESIAGMNCLRILRPSVPRAMRSIISLPAYFNPTWIISLRRAIREVRPDVLIVRDLPLARLAISEGRRFGIPCVVDMAENHPEMWRQVGRNDRWIIPSFFLKNVGFAKYLEKKVAAEADMILVVVEEMKEHLVSIGASPERVVVVSNTPDISSRRNVARKRLDCAGKEALDLIYTGYVTNRRGLDQVIKAMAILKDMSPEPRFHIVGDGKHLAFLRRLADSLNVSERVVFHGWVDHKQLSTLIADCDVGIVPHPRNGHTDHTVPNKIFDYMALGLPVLVSDARPLVRIVRETGCGTVFKDGDIAELAARITEYSDPDMRKALGECSLAAIESRYHWRVDYQIAVKAIQAAAVR